MKKVIRKFYSQFLIPNSQFLPILVIILLPLFFFIKPALGLSIIALGDLTGSDLLDLHYPFKVALSQSLGRFILPLWNNDLSLGFPIWAEGQSGPLYPINFLLSFVHPLLALNWSIILTFIIAGLGLYLYTRSLGFTRFSALVSAIVFMFSAFFVARAKHLNMIAVAAWVPFLFYLTRQLFETLKWRNVFYLGIVITLQFLAGHPQMTFFSLLIFLFYFIFESCLSANKKGWTKILPFSLLTLTLTLALTLTLSAVQILPTLELTNEAERTSWTLYSATGYPFHPKNLLTFISPYYFGNPAAGSYREDIQSAGIFWENASYIGLLPLLLALLTIFLTLRASIGHYLTRFQRFNRPNHFPNLSQSSQFSQSSQLSFFILLILFSLLMMLGRFTPVFGFFWENVPGFSLFRFPTRFNLFLIFSLAILAGFGAQKVVDKLETLKLSRPKAGPQEEEFQFSWPLSGWQTQALIIGVIVLDLFVFAKNYFGEIPTDSWLKKPGTIELLKEDNPLKLTRIWNVTQYGQSPYQALGWKNNQKVLLSIRQALPPNGNLTYRLSSFSDRGWFEGGLSTRKRNRLERFLLEENQDEIIMAKILGMFNVKYILTFSQAGGFEMTEKAKLSLGKEFGLPLKVFENQEFMERIFYVPEAKVIPDEEALLRQMADNSFLPSRTVLLEKEPRQIPPQFSGSLDDFKKENSLTLKKYDSTEVIIEAKIKNHGFLVLSDLYYPGWKVKVNNQAKEILPANFLVRAVELTPGEHTIRFYYDPLSFKLGAGISSVSGLFLLLLAIYKLKPLKKLKFRKD